MGGQCRVQTEDLGHMPLFRVQEWSVWGSQAKAGFIHSNPKQQSFGKFCQGSYLSSTQGEGFGSQGRLPPEACIVHIRKLLLLVTLQVTIYGMQSREKLVSVQGPCRLLSLRKMDAEAAISQSSLTKLLKTTGIYFSQFGRLEVQIQGTSKGHVLLRTLFWVEDC